MGSRPPSLGFWWNVRYYAGTVVGGVLLIAFGLSCIAVYVAQVVL
jgi:hypothetical protein